nr:FAD-dependent monooxygenase [Candidatus Sigynarchaeota archaeon]
MVVAEGITPKDIINCDVVIVGGSIAGNYLSSLLSKTRLNIHVIEEHGSIGHPMKCAGIVSSKILRIMRIPPRLIVNRVMEARIAGPGGKSITVRTRDKPIVLDRIEFDRHFMAIARDNGVTYHLEEKVASIEHAADEIVATSTKAVYHAKVLVGCDGASSMTGRIEGVVNEFITGKQSIISVAIGKKSMQIGQGQCELHFDPEWNDLFCWVIPTGNAALRVGLAAKNNVARKFDSFFKARFGNTLDELVRQGEIKNSTFTGGTIPVGIMKPCAFDRCLLVGDAACQVKASTGGGIVMLAIAAKYAARAIQEAFQKQDFSRRFFKKHYQTLILKRIGLTLRMHLAIHEGIKFFTAADFRFLIELGNQPMIKRELARSADMDFPVAFIIRILGYPMFYTWLLRFLLRNHQILRVLFRIIALGKEPRKSEQRSRTRIPS